MSADLSINDNYIFSSSQSTVVFVLRIIDEFLPENFCARTEGTDYPFSKHMKEFIDGTGGSLIWIDQVVSEDFIKIAHALEQGIEHMNNREWAHQFYIKIGYAKKESDISAGEQDYYKKRELFKDPSTKRKYLEEYKERFEKEWPNHNVSVEKYFDSSSVMYSMVPIETYFDMYMRHLDILSEILSEMKKDPRYKTE
ncbi:MAG: hypothetical protein ACOCXQ_00485 [Patescibacteria group bacterium]